MSLAATKKVMRHAMDHDWASSFNAEAELQQSLVGSEDNLEEINFYHDPSQFAGVSVSVQGPGLFTIVAPVETPT